MKDGARVAAAIDLLAEVLSSERPADGTVRAYFRTRRFIGSKDRQAVSGQVYGVIRRRAKLAWWAHKLAPALTGETTSLARALILIDLRLAQGVSEDKIAKHFTGERYEPAPLSAAEEKLLRDLKGRTLIHPEMSEAVILEIPEWAEPGLRKALGARLGEELAAMEGEAATDLRINPQKIERDEALRLLSKSGLSVSATPYSPYGVRLTSRAPIHGHKLFKNGAIEVQDEGSQLVALLLGAKPGEQVVDFCAGAGGKALAIAGDMNAKGRVLAMDVSEGRLQRAKERIKRAGVHNVEPKTLKSERDPWVRRHKEKFDRVLIDAPCSGVGTWRRNPDARWRTPGTGLGDLAKLQGAILASAARLAKPGGLVVYATCSLLHEENEGVVEAFLAEHPDFKVQPLAEVWQARFGAPPPADIAGPDFLKLTPARHKTDGFFAAFLVRTASALPSEQQLVRADAVGEE